MNALIRGPISQPLKATTTGLSHTKEKVRIVISLMFLGAGPLLMRAHTKKAKKVLEEKGLTVYFYWNCLLTILP